mmetsp:Transcript_14101/g.29807  ORF Transcript_14101/g.29807 Transcript_14101/m.29807 type:complete len:96 (-) Transcript_14101:532-819(-)
MRYDAVVAYGDECSESYSSCRLPSHLVPNPVNETATIHKNCKEYIQTDPTCWNVLKDGKDGRSIEAVPYTGESEEFSVKVTNEELAGLKDDNGDI